MQSVDVWSAGAGVAAVVADSVRRQVAELGLDGQPEAVLAVALAERIDDEKASATSVSLNAGRLLDALSRLRELAAERPAEVSPLDEIRARRDRRVSGASA